MKLPTKEEMFREFNSRGDIPAADWLHATVADYCALAEEEARRDEAEAALDRALNALESREQNGRWVWMRDVRAALQGLKAAPATAEAECAHRWVDPTNEVVESKGYEVCVECGKLKPPGATAEAGKDEAACPWRIEKTSCSCNLEDNGHGWAVLYESRMVKCLGCLRDMARIESSRRVLDTVRAPPAQPPSRAVTEEPTPMRAGLRGSCPHGYDANVLKCGLCDDEWVERVREIARAELGPIERALRDDVGASYGAVEEKCRAIEHRFSEDAMKRLLDGTIEKKLRTHWAYITKHDEAIVRGSLDSARSAAGGKTGEDDPMAVEREEMHKSMSAEACMKAWRRNFDRGREAGIREAVKWLRDDGSPSFAGEMERALLPAAREGSGA